MATKYWVGGSGTWNISSTTNWRTTSGGTTAAAVPTAADVVIFDSNSGSGAFNVTITAAACLDFQVDPGVSVTFTSTGQTTIAGSLTLPSSAVWNATGLITFTATSSKTITTGGTTFNAAVTFNGAGGTWALQDNFTMGSSRALTHTNGTINLNGKTLTVGTYTTAAGTKNITFNGGSLYVLNTGTAFNNAQPTNFTTTAGSNSQFNAIIMYGTGQTFAGAGSTYNCNLYVTNVTITGNNSFAGFGIEYAGGSSAIAITGSNSFGSAKIVNYGYTTTFTLTAGTTQTFTGTGDSSIDNKFFTPYSGTYITFQSATAGTQATISKTFSENVNTNYLTVQDIAFTPAPATDGSTPYVWYVGDISTNNGNVTGAVFINGSTTKVYLITDTSTSFWQVPSDWNNYNNTIHMIGGGGGGAAGLSTTNNWNGGGGGGGGYTKLLNFVTPYSLIPIAVGTGGGGGINGGGGAGIATTIGYTAYSANGGGGGTTGTASATAGGAGGIGATYTGGRGGGVGIGTTTQGRGGAGGGGSAGPNGNGGNGGYNITSTSQNAGAGGGGNGGGANGANSSATGAGAGGNGWLASGGGVVNGGNGSLGGGGAGTYVTASTLGGLGSMGLDILNTVGSSGGPGGSVSSTGSAARDGTYYGAGGAGGAVSSGQVARAGGSGAPGLILIVYSTVTTPFLAQRMVSTGNLLTNTLFDETVLSYHSVNSTAIYASSFNEVAISPINSGLARRIANTGEVQVAGVIDEITGIA